MLRHLVLFIALEVYGQQVFYVNLNNGPQVFQIYVGNPKQELYAAFSLELSNTIFLDNHCALRPKCCRYCNDETFSAMYCVAACQFIYATKNLVCNPEKGDYQSLPYYLTDSRTFELLNKPIWNSRTWFTDSLSGRFFVDQLVLVADDFNQMKNLEIENAVMIEGSFLDQVLFYDIDALVGFGLGENNIIQQLYAQNKIPSPVIHLSLNSTIFSYGLLKIGAYGEDSCVYWSEHNTQNNNRWVLEVENVELNGVRYEKKVKALITNHVNNVSLPSNFMNELVGANVLKTFNDTESLIYDSDFYFDCDRPLELHMTVDGRRLTISNPLLQQSQINDTHCLPYINQIGSLRYSTDVDMILGWPFLNRFCISFDYDKLTIRIAKNIRCNLYLC
ncbi:hypothetical protein M3Y95_01024800 [Aphelenchoides besseyi]|nr:hypothetical protein M3Y95_01024800 [Aphelenchoides besseyi]